MSKNRQPFNFRKLPDPEFWVCNFSKKTIYVEDLGVNIPAKSSINLLAKNNNFTWEQLHLSLDSGSLLKKNSVLKIRETAPKIPVSGIFIVKDPRISASLKSKIQVNNKKIEDLIAEEETAISDQKFILDFLEEEEEPVK